MRLIIIRHGESQSNRRDFTYASYVANGSMTSEEADAAKLKARFAIEKTGDTFLTDNGYEQARLLGEYWAPILSRKAREETTSNGKSLGKLHVFVSPMQRNFETAAPLMEKLRGELGAGADFTATVNADLFEIPAIGFPTDRPEFVRQMTLQQEGKFDELAQASEAFKGKWKPAGLTPNQMREKFPWAVVPDGAFPNGDDQGWWSGGFETWYQVNARMHRLCDWLEGLQETLPDNDVVLMITHGDQTSRMFNILLGRVFLGRDAVAAAVPTQPHGRQSTAGFEWMDLGPKSNTSVSSILMPPSSTGGKLAIEFFHRLDHLGEGTSPDTLMRGYQYMGLSNRAGERMQRRSPIGYYGLIAPDAKL